MTIREASIPERYSDIPRRVPIQDPERRLGPGGKIVVDISFRLPEKARQKLVALRDDADAAQGRWRSLEDRRQQWTETNRARREELETLLTPKGQRSAGGYEGHGLTAQDPEACGMSAQVEEAASSLRKATALAEEARKNMGDKIALIGALERYIGRLPRQGVLLDDAAVHKAELRKGETTLTAIVRIRGRLEEIIAKAAKIAAAPISSTAAKDLMRAEIARLAERGRPDVFEVIERAGEIGWPKVEPARMAIQGKDGLESFSAPPTFDAQGCFAWLHQKALISALELEIDRRADDKEALEPEERTKQLEMMRTLLLATEREEEALMLRSADEGLQALRRIDADPRAVLGLADEMPEPSGSLGPNGLFARLGPPIGGAQTIRTD
jgi:hypothetical protein